MIIALAIFVGFALGVLVPRRMKVPAPPCWTPPTDLGTTQIEREIALLKLCGKGQLAYLNGTDLKALIDFATNDRTLAEMVLADVRLQREHSQPLDRAPGGKSLHLGGCRE